MIFNELSEFELKGSKRICLLLFTERGSGPDLGSCSTCTLGAEFCLMLKSTHTCWVKNAYPWQLVVSSSLPHAFHRCRLLQDSWKRSTVLVLLKMWGFDLEFVWSYLTFINQIQLWKFWRGGESLQTHISHLDAQNDALCLLHPLKPSDSKLESAYRESELASKEAPPWSQAPRQPFSIRLALQSYSNAPTLKYEDENSTKQPVLTNTSSSVKCICCSLMKWMEYLPFRTEIQTITPFLPQIQTPTSSIRCVKSSSQLAQLSILHTTQSWSGSMLIWTGYKRKSAFACFGNSYAFNRQGRRRYRAQNKMRLLIKATWDRRLAIRYSMACMH